MSTTKINSKQDHPLSTDAMRDYLSAIGRVPLLTREQEILYSKRVQRMMTLLAEKEKLEKKLGLEPNLKTWAAAVGLPPEELTPALQQGQQAKKKMIESNLRLVVSIAKKYQKRNMELLDLIQEGSVGLERGVEKFDPSKGYKFSTYAYWWIRQAITRALAVKSRTIRIPIHVTEKINKIKKTERKLAQKLGRTATIAEVADELGVKLEDLRKCLKANQQPVSLDLRVGDDKDTEFSEAIASDGVSPEDNAAHNLMCQDVREILSSLPQKEREVLSLRFGLENGQALSLAQVGKKMNLSRERVRQLETRAITSLRYNHPHMLRDYLVG